MKSGAKRRRNNFVRTVRAEASLNCYTRALGFVLTRDRDQAVRLLQERVDACRKELAVCNQKRETLNAPAPVNV